MINSTLGGLIKDYRLQKGISQLDIAFSLGWKETSRLSRIEQGRTEKPTRELIDRIILTLELTEQEKNSLLLSGGYLPTEEEIEKIRIETKNVLENWQYPAFMLDFSWRIIYQNKNTLKALNISEKDNELIHKFHPRVLDMLLNPAYENVNGEKALDLRNLLKSVILNFKYDQKHRTKEKWFIEHVKNLMDFDLFRELWMETSSTDALDEVIGKFAYKSFVSPKDKNKNLNFFLFVVPFLKDPRFEIELLVPRDIETYQYFE